MTAISLHSIAAGELGRSTFFSRFFVVQDIVVSPSFVEPVLPSTNRAKFEAKKTVISSILIIVLRRLFLLNLTLKQQVKHFDTQTISQNGQY